MKLVELFKNYERQHSKNDLIACIKKVLEGAHFNTLSFKLKSSETDLGNGDLKFEYKGKNYHVNHRGDILENNKVIDKVQPNADIHTHYSNALHKLRKRFEETQ